MIDHTRVKEREYERTCWEGYVRYVKSNTDRVLTREDYCELMQSYINGVPAEQVKLENKE